MNRFWLLLMPEFVLAGCVTLAPMDLQEREKLLAKWGSDCREKEGGSQIILQNSEQRIVLTLDWITDSQGSLTAEFSDALGQPLGTITFEKDNLKTTRPALLKTYAVSVTDDGFIWMGGYNTNLKSSELGCLLGGKLPIEWLSQLNGEQVSWHSRERDKVRKIDFEGSYGDTCGSVQSAGFLGWMKGKLNICLGQGSGKISYGDHYFFEWRVLGGENS